jgi:predicted RNase H-like nuclease (RuvC/YqgF family)
MSRVIGVDPGLTGALAIIDDAGAVVTLADIPIIHRIHQ